jgi:hypothetical protein
VEVRQQATENQSTDTALLVLIPDIPSYIARHRIHPDVVSAQELAPYLKSLVQGSGLYLYTATGQRRNSDTKAVYIHSDANTVDAVTRTLSTQRRESATRTNWTQRRGCHPHCETDAVDTATRTTSTPTRTPSTQRRGYRPHRDVDTVYTDTGTVDSATRIPSALQRGHRRLNDAYTVYTVTRTPSTPRRGCCLHCNADTVYAAMRTPSTPRRGYRLQVHPEHL